MFKANAGIELVFPFCLNTGIYIFASPGIDEKSLWCVSLTRMNGETLNHLQVSKVFVPSQQAQHNIETL